MSGRVRRRRRRQGRGAGRTLASGSPGELDMTHSNCASTSEYPRICALNCLCTCSSMAASHRAKHMVSLRRRSSLLERRPCWPWRLLARPMVWYFFQGDATRELAGVLVGGGERRDVLEPGLNEIGGRFARRRVYVLVRGRLCKER